MQGMLETGHFVILPNENEKLYVQLYLYWEESSPPASEISNTELAQSFEWRKIVLIIPTSSQLGKTSTAKKRFLSGFARIT